MTTTKALVDRRRAWQSICSALRLTLIAGDLLWAQAPSRFTLSSGTVGPSFTEVTAIRELEDGRTLVIDSKERLLAVVNWSSPEPRSIGRVGDGPGEYRNPGHLVALRGDSTLFTDRHTGKWFILHRDRITSTLTSDRQLVRFVGVFPAGADTMGRLLAQHGSHFLTPGLPGPGSTEVADSIAVILVGRDNGNADTIARIRGPFRGQNRVRKRVGEMNITYFLVNPLQAGDQALLFPDGWIATAFVDPYRVEWRTPKGGVVRGHPLPYSPQPVDERVKRHAIEDKWPTSPQAPQFASTDFVGWPDVVPPFLRNALSALPDGKVAILRTSLGADRSVQYDIVDRRGTLAGILRLPPNERIVGFGRRSVYVVATDADDNEILRRHAWP